MRSRRPIASWPSSMHSLTHSLTVITHSLLTWLARYHPDKTQNKTGLLFTCIHAAYTILSDEVTPRASAGACHTLTLTHRTSARPMTRR